MTDCKSYPPSWTEVAPHETLFVLVTGANSGVGLGVCERLIDQFLATREPNHHLILIASTRSESKSLATIKTLRRHAAKNPLSQLPAQPSSGGDGAAAPKRQRIHPISVQIDLCDLPSIYRAADQLLADGVVDLDDSERRLVRIPRLDAVVLNAGAGGWDGVGWMTLFKQFFTYGMMDCLTWPVFKAQSAQKLIRRPGRPGVLAAADEKKRATAAAEANGGSSRSVAPRPASAEDDEAVLDSVFCANVFGHYVLVHEVLPLLSLRRKSDGVPPAKIIWTSSIEPFQRHFSVTDIQGFRSEERYESTKRLTDILSLTATLPGVVPFSSSYTTLDSNQRLRPQGRGHLGEASEDEEEAVRPRMYVSHPGIVFSTLFPVNIVIYCAYFFVLHFARLVGSPWHVVDGYRAGLAATWLVLTPTRELDERHAERTKWGSACTRWGRPLVKATEVDGWGWDGEVGSVEADTDEWVLKRESGRRDRTKVLTNDERVEFEAIGAECWKEMEALRKEWADILGRGKRSNGSA